MRCAAVQPDAQHPLGFGVGSLVRGCPRLPPSGGGEARVPVPLWVLPPWSAAFPRIWRTRLVVPADGTQTC